MIKKFKSLIRKNSSNHTNLTKKQKKVEIQEFQTALTEIELRDK